MPRKFGPEEAIYELQTSELEIKSRHSCKVDYSNMISEDLQGKVTISRRHRIWPKIKIHQTTTSVLLCRTMRASDVPSTALTFSMCILK